MTALFGLLLLVALGLALYRLGRYALGQWRERRRARSRWTVETRAMRPTVARGTTHHKKKWLVTLRRPGEEQVFATVDVDDTDGLLQAQADADAQAHVLNEGRRK